MLEKTWSHHTSLMHEDQASTNSGNRNTFASWTLSLLAPTAAYYLRHYLKAVAHILPINRLSSSPWYKTLFIGCTDETRQAGEAYILRENLGLVNMPVHHQVNKKFTKPSYWSNGDDRTSLSGIAVQHADDGYFRRGNFGSALLRNVVLSFSPDGLIVCGLRGRALEEIG